MKHTLYAAAGAFGFIVLAWSGARCAESSSQARRDAENVSRTFGADSMDRQLPAASSFATPEVSPSPSPNPAAAIIDKIIAETETEQKKVAKRFSVEERQKIFCETVEAERLEDAEVERLLLSGQVKPGPETDTRERLHQKYTKPVTVRYGLTVEEVDAVKVEGIDADWPTPRR